MLKCKIVRDAGKFVKDYADLMKHQGQFCKSHWKGIVVLNVGLIGAGVAACEIQTRNMRKYERRYNEQARAREEYKRIPVNLDVAYVVDVEDYETTKVE